MGLYTKFNCLGALPSTGSAPPLPYITTNLQRDIDFDDYAISQDINVSFNDRLGQPYLGHSFINNAVSGIAMGANSKKCCKFGTSPNYINLPNFLLPLHGAFTIDLVYAINADISGNNLPVICGNSLAGGAEGRFKINCSYNVTGFYSRDGSFSSNIVQTVGKPYSIFLRRTSTNMVMNVNNGANSSIVFPSSANIYQGDLTMGYEKSYGIPNISIYSCRIYNTDLSDSDMTRNFNYNQWRWNL